MIVFREFEKLTLLVDFYIFFLTDILPFCHFPRGTFYQFLVILAQIFLGDIVGCLKHSLTGGRGIYTLKRVQSVFHFLREKKTIIFAFLNFVLNVCFDHKIFLK